MEGASVESLDRERVCKLTVVDGVHSTGLLDVEGVLVHTASTGSFLVHLSNLEDVIQSVQTAYNPHGQYRRETWLGPRRKKKNLRNLDDLVVHRLQQIAQRLDASLGDKVSDLGRLLKSTRGSVRQSPAGLLFGLEISGLEDVDQRGDNVGVDDGLDLVSAMCSHQTRSESRRSAGERAEERSNLPAVTLEIVQQASFLMPSLEELSKASRAERAPEAITTWVCKSSPVTMFPTDRRAGVWTEVEGCL